jgi:predicted GNAT superfamily acetyltransferase
MAVEITELSELEDLRRLASLLAEVWGRSGEPPIASDILKALSHSGGYLAGAISEGRMIGGLVGWLGGRPPHELHLHSHILGVVSGSDAQGLGFALKQHQRAWCLEREIKVIEWTTDPLVRRNAYFNLTKLGARAPRYLVNFYGVMADGINAGEESDRLLISWNLDSPQAVAAAEGRAPETSVSDLIAAGAGALLTVGPAGEPVMAPAVSAGVLLCQVPEDIVEVRRSNPALARAWRLALRKSLGDALASGWQITGASRSGWYVLRPAGQGGRRRRDSSGALDSSYAPGR